MINIALMVLLGGVVLLLVSLPLALRKVPMNRLWGVRVRAAFESDQRWYDINAVGGRLLARGSLLIIATGIAGLLLPADLLAPYTWSAGVISFLSVLVPCVKTCRWIRRSTPADPTTPPSGSASGPIQQSGNKL